MDPLWLVLPVVLVLSAEAETPTKVMVAPGQNATLNCSGATNNLYWYIEIRSQVRGSIARTFSSDPRDTQFCNPVYRTKYIPMGQQLTVTNVTAEDFRLYFCAQKQNDNITVINTFHLLSDVPITPFTNRSDANLQQHICTTWPSQLVVYCSFTLNAVLALVTGGVVFMSLRLKRKNYNSQVNEAPPLTYEDPETLEVPQYEEIRTPSPAPPPECIYYKAQLPPSTLPQHHRHLDGNQTPGR